FKDFDVFTTTNKIAAEIEVLKSNVLISKALDSLDFDIETYRKGKIRTVELYHDSPFKVHASIQDDSLFDRTLSLRVHSSTQYHISIPGQAVPVKGRFGDLLRIQSSTLLISIDSSVLQKKHDVKLVDEYEIKFLSRQKLVDKIAKELDIIPIDKDVAVIRISFKSAVPEKASLLVNQLAKSYIQDFIESKYKTAETTVQFLNSQIATVSGNLSQSEQNIVKYRDDRNIINLRQETETDLRQISQLKIQQTNVKMSLRAIQDLDKYIQDGKENFFDLAPNFEAFTDLLSTEIIKNIKKLQADKKDLLLQYTADEEKVQVIDRKLNDLKTYLIESIHNTRRNLEIKDQKLNEDISESEKAFIGIPEKEKMLTILNREFDLYQKSYNFLTEKKIEAEIAKAAKIAFHRVIAPAMAAKDPVSPNKTIITILSGVLALIGSIIFIYGVHAAKAKVNDSYTIEKNSAVPVLLVTPKTKSQKETSTIFLKAAIQLELKQILQPESVFVVSSYKAKEGRSFHSTQLAQAFRAQGRKVLFIQVGTTENSESGFITLNPEECKAWPKQKMAAWLEEQRRGFDLVIINNESLENETIGLMLMSLATTNLLVVDSRRTSVKQLMKTDLLKEEFQLPGLYFVLNRAGYNPNLVMELVQFGTRLINRKRSKN
ncbi:MAG TPA: GNVR domain-containing protein, partial [Catalimonadaceae bacterium]|nr:GNVR domain-containing protein [Catalimonadaceae bacterium]